MSVLMIATIGDDPEPIFVGVRDYPVKQLVLLATESDLETAQRVKNQLEPLRIQVSIEEVDTADMLMDTLHKVSRIQREDSLGFTDVILNVSSGEKMQTCSALSAAFVNGIAAIGIADDKPFSLPVLKFSYQELISDAKFKVLASLHKLGGKAESLQALGQASGIEKSLLSYHLRTTREGKGLEEMGLVQIERGSFGRLTITLTEMGELMLLGR